MRPITNSCDVLIGGAGIAAAASALRLCALGFRPLMLATTRDIVSGVEAIPDSAWPLFAELEAEQVLRDAGASLVEGFENHWDPERPTLRPGCWIHVAREKLARAAVREAVRRGTVVQLCRSLPKLCQEHDTICSTYDGSSFRFEAAIDATGRSAVWSRPIRRSGGQIADVYDIPSSQSATPGKVVQFSAGWAYRIGVPTRTTMAMLSPDARKRQAPDSLTRKVFCVSSDSFVYAGRRPAFPQWSDDPISGRRMAVGDAALAYDPLAGQGIRFALSSALTAASVINTWRTTPSQAAAAERFYRSFVARCRQTHLEFIDRLRGEPPLPQPKEALPEIVRFSGCTVTSDLQVDSTIRTDEAILLRDGSCVRWVEGMDLLRLRDLVPQPVQASILVNRLVPDFCGLAQSTELLRWCLRHHVLSPAE
jgi:flavin-dependent dehydrogenase